MKVNFLVLANFASTLSNGAPVLVGIFRGIRMESFPGRLEPFWMATEIEAEPHESGEHVFDVRLIDEDGRTVYENQIGAAMEARPGFLPVYMYFCGQVFVQNDIQKPGVYRFDLSWRGEDLAQARLEIGT